MTPFFKPFIGREYPFGGLFKKKIMVLGDSHYCGTPCGSCGINPNPKCNRFTTDVVEAYLDPNCEREGWMNTYLKFERSLVGHETALEESKKIWNSLLFYNYLQVAMQGPRQAGTPEQYQMATSPFFAVIDEYQPDTLIVWGVRLWNNLPNERWIDGKKMQMEGQEILNGYYKTSLGRRVKVLCVYHPSAGYSWDFWYRVIQRCL